MIDPTTQLAALIRAQFTAQFQARAKRKEGGVAGSEVPAGRDGARTPRSEASPSGAAGGLGIPLSPSKDEDAQLHQLVALRVRALSPTDPERERKAFRLFLESVLVQTFGRDRLDDKGFEQMVDAVMQRMEGDAELRAALKQAGRLLLSESPA